LRSPKASQGEGGALGEAEALKRGNTVGVRDQVMDLVAGQGLQVSRQSDNLLPTPRAQEPGSTSAGYGDGLNDVANRLVHGFAPKDLLSTPAVAHVRNHDEPVEDYLQRRQDFIDGKTKGMPGASLGVAVRMEMLPTPQALEGHHGNNLSVKHRESQGRQVMLSNHAVDFANNRVNLLPTVQVDDAKNTGHNQERRATLASEVWLAETTTNWGKFEPAIRRWEALTRPAPAPTKPDGKDGAHRLSAEFTEWMMGLPEGWVTSPEIGLKRNDQLKACGNGVVPQQAEMALRILLQDLVI